MINTLEELAPTTVYLCGTERDMAGYGVHLEPEQAQRLAEMEPDCRQRWALNVGSDTMRGKKCREK